MQSLALFGCIVVSLTYQASGAPLGGEQGATRDITKEIPEAQNGLTLEEQLRENVKTPHAIKPLVKDSLPSPQAFNSDGERSEGNVPREHLSPEDSAGDEHADNSDAIPSEDESKSPFNNETGSPSDNESAVLPSSTGKAVVEESQTEEGLSDSDMSEEEEILRTIIVTLRDNPELIKALIDSETEEMQDEFYKQKARVSNPDDSEELWGTFQRPNPQLQKMPKQIEKKAGQPSYHGDKSQVTDSVDSDEIQEYPAEQDLKDGPPQEAEDEVENGKPDVHRHETPLNVLRAGKMQLPSESDSREQMETDKHSGEEDDSRNAETLINDTPHTDEQPTHLESEGRSVNRPHHPTAEQTVHRARHTPGKEDSDENELLALSKASNFKNTRLSRPHM
ncbi:uncharacterized protein LOC135468733 [Liolophura sinensis]|uniref:uncharacterized protein LOC135468733 n=1 Tax=Liolophura sinensis TaxID=3198878 RepID=UPI003158B53B